MIRGPKRAIPTSRGWIDPRSGELLESRNHTQAQIDEWMAANGMVEEKPAPIGQVLTEAPPANKSLEEMTKLELEATGRHHGIELDRRKTKDDLIEELEEHLDED